MSVKQMLMAWDTPLDSASEKLVLLKLADNAHDDGTSAKPGILHLMHKTNRSEATVRRALRGLEDAGLIRATKYATGGRGCATEYQLTLENGLSVGGVSDPKGAHGGEGKKPRPSTKGAHPEGKGAHPDMSLPLMKRQEPKALKASTASRSLLAREPDPVQELVGFYVDECTRNSYHATRPLKSAAGQQIKRLLPETSPDKIRTALTRCAVEHKNPGNLSLVLIDVESGSNGHRPNPTRSQNQINADIAARRMGLNPADSDPFGGAPDEPWSRRTM